MALQHRLVVLSTLSAFVLSTLLAFVLVAVPAGAEPWRADVEATNADWSDDRTSSVVLAANDRVDLESHGGYTGQYIFGMTKGVMRSTLVPALKPVALLFTVPLDIAFLPFAAIGGFFR